MLIIQVYQIGSFHHCVLLFNNHLLPLPGAMDASNGSQQLGPKICLSKNRLVAWTDNTSWILSFATCTCKNLEVPVSLYISNQNFHGCLDTSPKAYWRIMTNQHLMGPFHCQWFASKTCFTFCHRRSAFRMVSTFLTDDSWQSLHQGWYALVGRLRLCFAGQPRNRWEMGQVLPSCLRNVARMEWFTSQTIDVVALLWGSSFCSWNLLRVVTYAQMRPTL